VQKQRSKALDLFLFDNVRRSLDFSTRTYVHRWRHHFEIKGSENSTADWG